MQVPIYVLLPQTLKKTWKLNRTSICICTKCKNDLITTHNFCKIAHKCGLMQEAICWRLKISGFRFIGLLWTVTKDKHESLGSKLTTNGRSNIFQLWPTTEFWSNQNIKVLGTYSGNNTYLTTKNSYFILLVVYFTMLSGSQTASW
jgi:hypothetical protein